jgi:hypothetical protein
MNEPSQHAVQTGSELRRRPRFKQEMMKSSVGEVLDLSRSGMRVLGRHLAPHSKHVVRITCFGTAVGPIDAQVVWTRKVGIFKWESGLQFTSVDDATSDALARAALVSRNQRTM